MRSILTRLRSGDNSQGIRQSTALTTVYLLEMNRKFESFMRDKVEELEGRVAAQQARLSTKIDAEAGDWEDGLLEEETIPADDLGWEDEIVPIVDVASEPRPDLSPCPETKVSPDDTRPAEPQVEPEEPATVPDYMTLLIGTPSDPEPEPAAETAAAPGNEEDRADRFEPEAEPVDLPAHSAYEPRSESEVANGLDPEADEDGIQIEEAPDNEPQLVEEGISALDLLAQEGVDDTIPWFVDEQATVIGKISAGTAGPTAPADIPETDAPAEAVENNEEETEPWDARLPAEGRKGEWT